MDYYSIDDIKRINRSNRGHWFEPDTLRFFRSRISDTAYNGPGGVYFVSSEQFVDSQGRRAPRRFTVRKFNPETGGIDTVGPFNVYTRNEAHTRAKACAAGKPIADDDK